MDNYLTGILICVVFGFFYWAVLQHIPYHLRQQRYYRGYARIDKMDDESDRAYAERLLDALRGRVRFDEYSHPIAEHILNVRRRAAADFSEDLSGVRFEAYDRAVLDVYREVEAYLTGEPKRDRYGRPTE